MKRILNLVIALSMILSFIPVMAAETNLVPWPALQSRDANVYPADNYITEQNPPGFVWRYVDKVKYYVLEIFDDPSLTTPLYSVETRVCAYMFPHTFDKNKTYYWRVKYITDDGKTSEWTEVRRFKIDADAIEFPVPPVDELLENLPDAHPYYKMDWDRYKNLPIKDIVVNQAELYIAKPLPDMVVNMSATKYSDVACWMTMSYRIYLSAMAYKMTGEKKYLDAVKESLAHIKDWDPAKSYQWDANTDVYDAEMVERVAIAFDWVYNELSSQERADTVKYIERCISRPILYFAGGVDTTTYSSTIYKYQKGSHEWRLNGVLLTSLIIYKDSKGIKLPDLSNFKVDGMPLPENKKLLKGVKIGNDNVVEIKDLVEFHLPIMLAKHAYNGVEDGTSAAGPLYMGTNIEETFFGLRQMGIIDVLSAPYYRNLDYYLLYTSPKGWYNSIGDSYGKPIEDVSVVKSVLNGQLYISENPVMQSVNKWFLKSINGGIIGNTYDVSLLSSFLRNDFEDIEEKPPVMLPTSKLFKDSGWVAMYNQLANVEDRVGMIFISSPFGSQNHSHPHQNSFVIQAYGEYLAIDSDYYDSYHSTFDKSYNKQTFAHNSITFDGGVGQPRNSMTHNGYISEFLIGTDMSLAGGNAKNAYGATLNKFDRRIIYIKPETYIVIDDLAAPDKKSWEWWLNAYGDISVYEDYSGAQVSKGDVNLDVKFHYPNKLDPNYINYFAGPDLNKIPAPTGSSGRFYCDPKDAPDKRVYFATEETEATKIITTLDVNKKENGQKYVKSEQIGNVVKLSFEDGTIAYIKNDDSETMTIDHYVTDADAVIERDDSYMMVDGTYLTYGGLKLVEADVPCSVLFGDNEISLSSIDNDANIKIYAPLVNKLTRIKNEKAIVVNEGEDYGIFKYIKDGDYINLYMFQGDLYFFVNDKPLLGTEKDIKLTLEIDGVKEVVNIKGNLDANGDIYTEYINDNLDGIFVYRDSDGIQMDAKEGQIKIFKNNPLVIISENPYIKLDRVKESTVTADYYDDNNKDFTYASLIKRAENYDEIDATIQLVYWSSLSANTVQYFEDTEESLTYYFDVTEPGEYDIILSYSTVSGQTADRIYKLDDHVGMLTVEKTDIYSDLDELRIRTKAYLEPGRHELTFMAISSGQWILDKIGLIRSDR